MFARRAAYELYVKLLASLRRQDRCMASCSPTNRAKGRLEVGYAWQPQDMVAGSRQVRVRDAVVLQRNRGVSFVEASSGPGHSDSG